MEWTDVQVIVPVKHIETAEAIAQMAVPYGIYIEDYSDMLELVPEIAHITLIDEELLQKDRTTAIVHLYISPDQSPLEAVSFLTHMLQREDIQFTVQTAKLREEEWATAWKEYYHPTPIGEKLVVVPTWEDYSPKDGELIISLDPGMAFGTGTHHTTRLCAEILERTVKTGDTLLDMGTGSGILSIAALLLGAKNAVGVDIDAIAVRTAKENAEQNGFVPPQFDAVCADLISNPELPCEHECFDVIAANIVADVIIALAPAIERQLKTGGTLVASGIIEPRRDEVISALEAVNVSVTEVIEHDGWVALVGTK